MPLPEECHIASIRFQDQFPLSWQNLFRQHLRFLKFYVVMRHFRYPKPTTFVHPGCPCSLCPNFISNQSPLVKLICLLRAGPGFGHSQYMHTGLLDLLLDSSALTALMDCIGQRSMITGKPISSIKDTAWIFWITCQSCGFDDRVSSILVFLFFKIILFY